jgi:Cu/Zn superoxide dismutase
MKSFLRVPILLLLVVLSSCVFEVTSINATSNQFAGYVTAYQVTLSDLSDSGVTGFVSIFTESDNSTIIGYGGKIFNVKTNLNAQACNVTNGCGVHIHNGTSCTNSSTQGVHYFNSALVPNDPWVNKRYSSDSIGSSNFSGILDIGTHDVSGRVFIGTSAIFRIHLMTFV